MGVIKTSWLLAISVILTILMDSYDMQVEKFMILAIVGISANQLWKKELPSQELNIVSNTFKPLVYGMAGASVSSSLLSIEILVYSLIIIITALILRLIGAYLVSFKFSLTVWERSLIAACQMPKSLAQSTLGPILLYLMINTKDSDLASFGKTMMVVFFITTIIASVIGSSVISGLIQRQTPNGAFIAQGRSPTEDLSIHKEDTTEPNPTMRDTPSTNTNISK
jgi:hypothetical protein